MKWQTLKIGLWSAAGVGLGPGTSSRWAGQTRQLSKSEGLFLHPSFC